MNTNQKIASQLLTTRERLGLSQQYVADNSGLSQAGYGRIERGEVNIKYTRLCQIAKAMNVDVASFTSYDSSLFAAGKADVIERLKGCERRDGRGFSTETVWALIQEVEREIRLLSTTA